MVELARELGARPTASLPCAFSQEAALKGAYRFFENPNIAAAAILDSHAQSTYRRAACVPLVCRAVPDVPCNVLLEEDEWRALCCRVRQTTQAPPAPPPLHEAVRAIAQRGGFMARKSGAQPGVTVLWRGFHQLQEITAMYRIFKPLL